MKKLFGLVPAFLALVLAFPVYAGTPIVNSVRITGPHTVTVTYSEAVYTTLNDYSAFTGALSGASLSYIAGAGSGTNVILLTFTGNSFPADATGGLTIASTVKSVSDNSSVGSGPYTATDGQPPLLSSFSMSSDLANGTVARTGNKLSISFTPNEQATNITATIAGHAVAADGAGYAKSASYTLTSSDPQDIIPVSVSFTDVAGNQGSGSFTLGGGLGPRITSITSDATASEALGVNGTIRFVLTLASPVPNAYVSGSYDGVPLSWNTANGGATYTATFTVQSTSPSTSAPMQISGVTVRDPAGNVSSPGYGYDIQKTINSQSFTLSQPMTIASPVAAGVGAKFGFFSAQDGAIKYGGSCSSSNLSAATGYNYVTFKPLPDGTFSNCTVTVTNAAGYASNTLAVPAFTVGSGVSAGGSSSDTGNSTGTGSAYTYKFYNPLNLGSEGADVTALQKRLTAEGYYSGPANGRYGPLTQTAVKKYQKAHGLTQLGNVGPGTRASLNGGQ